MHTDQVNQEYQVDHFGNIIFDPNIGNQISEKYTDFIMKVFGGNVRIFNMKKFVNEYGYQPVISSILIVGDGFGSYDYDVVYNGNNINIYIHNGNFQNATDIINNKFSLQEIVGEAFYIDDFIRRYVQYLIV